MHESDRQQIKQFALVSEIEKSLKLGKMSKDTGYEHYHISVGHYFSLVSDDDENYTVAKTSTNADWYSDSVIVVFYTGNIKSIKCKCLSRCEFANSMKWILPESICQKFYKI